jgi:UbiD family decarboxylase
MADGMREWIAALDKAGEIARARREVDARLVPAVIARAPGAALIERVAGFEVGAVGGRAATRRRVAIGMDCPENDIGKKFQHAMDHPIDPVVVGDAPWDVTLDGAAVDLTRLPLPVLHEKDGGPYISSGVVVARDPDSGARNAGVYPCTGAPMRPASTWSRTPICAASTSATWRGAAAPRSPSPSAPT